VCASRVRGSGSLAFPAPSFTLTVAGRVFEVFPCASSQPKGCRRASAALFHHLWWLSPASSRPARARTPGRPPESLAEPARPARWSREARPAMHKCTAFVCFIRRLRRVSSSRSPPSVLRVGRPLPIALPKQSIFGPAVPPAWVPFRPRGFSPPRRFPPSSRCGHCCSPLPILGFTVFPDQSACTALPKEVPAGVDVPHDALTPRSCSLSAAPASSPRRPEGHRVHGRRCPLAVSTTAPVVFLARERARVAHLRDSASRSASRLCSPDRSLVVVHRFQ
jgi:hypothetical protein